MMLGSLTSQQRSTRAGFAVIALHWSQGTGDSPRDPHHTRRVPIPALLCYITAGVKPAQERPEGEEKRFVCIAMVFPGATRPSSPRDTEGWRVPGHRPLGETSPLPAPFSPHSPLRKDSSRGIFSKKKKKSLKTPVVNEQLVLSETQCGHVQTRRCPCPAPRCPYCCQTAPGAGLSGIFWDVSSWKQLGHTHKNKKKM